MGKKLTVLLGILLLFFLIRHLYLYHSVDIKMGLVWLKDNLGWEGLIWGGLIYMILLSIPFFPGVEVGWLLIMIFHKEGVIVVYFFTICGLNLSFLIGRRLENSWFTSWLDIDFLKRTFNERTSKIKKSWNKSIPRRFSDMALKSHFSKFRYVIIAILINTPGNALIGGGGGISLICGMNRGFSWKGFIVTIVVATSPIPLLLYFGFLQIETLIK